MTGLLLVVLLSLAPVPSQAQVPSQAGDTQQLAASDAPAPPSAASPGPAPADANRDPATSLTLAAPTWKDRREVFFKRLFGPQAVLETIPGATFDTARGFPAQWPRTSGGFAKRVGSQYGQFLVGETIELGVSAIHHEDPRYFRMPSASFGRRLRHSLLSTVVVRDMDGSPTIGLARLANVYGSWAIATSWNPPQQRNVWKIAGNGTLGLGLKAGSNLLREFWPDVKNRFRR